MQNYTSNSYNLNNTLLQHHRRGTSPPRHINSHLDYDDEDNAPEIDTNELDHLINSHKLPHDMTVYSGLHFHPNEHTGKLLIYHHICPHHYPHMYQKILVKSGQ